MEKWDRLISLTLMMITSCFPQEVHTRQYKQYKLTHCLTVKRHQSVLSDIFIVLFKHLCLIMVNSPVVRNLFWAY